jgi:hypothetical protein
MLKEQLKLELAARGWKEDRFGHHQKVLKRTLWETGAETEKTYRVKVQATSVRVEVKTVVGWVKVDGAYFKDIEITDHGAVQIGRKLLK